MALTEQEKEKAWEALNGRKPLSMVEVDQMEKKMSPQDREVFHNLMYGKTQKSPEDVYELLRRNTVQPELVWSPSGEIVNQCPPGYVLVKTYSKRKSAPAGYEGKTWVLLHCRKKGRRR